MLVYSLENQENEKGKPARSKPGVIPTVHDMPCTLGYPVVYNWPAYVDFEAGEQPTSLAA
jgi:hypothetical protein